MPLGLYLRRYREKDTQKPVTADSQGNVPQLQIRGTTVELGDGAVASGATSVALLGSATGAEGIAIGNGSSATAANAVALGDGVSNSVASTVAIGSAGGKLAALASTGRSYLAPAVATAGAAPSAANLFSGIYNMNAALTWPTAAAVVAVFPNAAVGDCCLFTVVNATAGALGQAGAGGATVLDSSWSIASHGARTFVIRLTNVTAASEAYTVS